MFVFFFWRGVAAFFFCVAGFLSGPVTGLLVGLMIFVKLVFYVKILFCLPCVLRSWIFSRPGTGLLVWLMILVKWAVWVPICCTVFPGPVTGLLGRAAFFGDLGVLQ